MSGTAWAWVILLALALPGDLLPHRLRGLSISQVLGHQPTP